MCARDMSRWLAIDHDDSAISRSLTVLGASSVRLCEYKLTVHTSHLRNAGTDANIFFQLKGIRVPDR